MKKLIFIVLLIAPLLHHAQSELVLNQVLLVELTTVGITVPTGKAWKVERSITNYTPQNGDSFEINGKSFYVWSGGGAFPIWLPAGTVVKSGTNIGILSVLEFNLVPLSAPQN